jgi:hypothetical protein
MGDGGEGEGVCAAAIEIVPLARSSNSTSLKIRLFFWDIKLKAPFF